jgi:hypothetical protein
MEEKIKTIEVCLGVGLNQFFPEIVKIELPQEGKAVLGLLKNLNPMSGLTDSDNK